MNIPASEVPQNIKDVLDGNIIKGIALLDIHVPNWREKVNTNEIDMDSAKRCVIGQVYGSYAGGLDALALYHFNEYGFNYTTEINDANNINDTVLMDYLTGAWKIALA